MYHPRQPCVPLRYNSKVVRIEIAFALRLVAIDLEFEGIDIGIRTVGKANDDQETYR